MKREKEIKDWLFLSLMFTHNINPVMLSLGPINIYYYGLFYVVGIIIGLLLLQYYRRQGKLLLGKDQVYDLVFWMAVGMIIGARLFYVLFWKFGFYMDNPWDILMIWKGGLNFHGALVGVVVAAYLYSRKMNIKFLRLADLMIIPMLIVLAVGRLANFINAEIVGKVTDVAWCFDFGDGQCRHPYQLYSMVKRMLLAGLLVFLNRRRHKDGFIFWMFIFLMGVSRFIIDFWREDILYLGLAPGQWLSLIMVLVGAFILMRSYRMDLKRII